ncbi:unnamed protein product, partial [Discosporangium mesarthrocarpum]
GGAPTNRNRGLELLLSLKMDAVSRHGGANQSNAPKGGEKRACKKCARYKEMLAAMRKQLEPVVQGLTDEQAKVKRLEAQVGNLEADIDRRKDQVNALQAEVASLKQENLYLNKRRSGSQATSSADRPPPYLQHHPTPTPNTIPISAPSRASSPTQVLRVANTSASGGKHSKGDSPQRAPEREEEDVLGAMEGDKEEGDDEGEDAEHNHRHERQWEGIDKEKEGDGVGGMVALKGDENQGAKQIRATLPSEGNGTTTPWATTSRDTGHPVEAPTPALAAKSGGSFSLGGSDANPVTTSAGPTPTEADAAPAGVFAGPRASFMKKVPPPVNVPMPVAAPPPSLGGVFAGPTASFMRKAPVESVSGAGRRE